MDKLYTIKEACEIFGKNAPILINHIEMGELIYWGTDNLLFAFVDPIMPHSWTWNAVRKDKCVRILDYFNCCTLCEKLDEYN